MNISTRSIKIIKFCIGIFAFFFMVQLMLIFGNYPKASDFNPTVTLNGVFWLKDFSKPGNVEYKTGDFHSSRKPNYGTMVRDHLVACGGNFFGSNASCAQFLKFNHQMVLVKLAKFNSIYGTSEVLREFWVNGSRIGITGSNDEMRSNWLYGSIFTAIMFSIDIVVFSYLIAAFVIWRI